MKIVLIYNIKSGQQATLQLLRKLFKAHGVTIDYSFTVKQLSSRKLADLVRKGVTVAAVGGDGTQNSAARLVAGTKSTLLPLPGGTFNHFIRDLGMPITIEGTLDQLATAKLKVIDVAYVNDELFLNNSNIGLYPFSLIERKHVSRIIGKWPAAVLSAFDQLVLFRRHRLVIDGEKVHSPFVFIGNNVYNIESSLIPERKNLNGGLLTVMVASSSSRFGLLRAVSAVIKGDISRRDDFTFSTRTSLAIYSHQPRILVSFDGEVKKLTTPLEYRIAPHSLRILHVKALNS